MSLGSEEKKDLSRPISLHSKALTCNGQMKDAAPLSENTRPSDEEIARKKDYRGILKIISESHELNTTLPAFWTICKLSNFPYLRHDSKASAIAEAERLAASVPGQTFVVMKSEVARYKKGPPWRMKRVKFVLPKKDS